MRKSLRHVTRINCVSSIPTSMMHSTSSRQRREGTNAIFIMRTIWPRTLPIVVARGIDAKKSTRASVAFVARHREIRLFADSRLSVYLLAACARACAHAMHLARSQLPCGLFLIKFNYFEESVWALTTDRWWYMWWWCGLALCLFRHACVFCVRIQLTFVD